eukprot:scaffold2123_cov96-Cylindrotheca_fusiformis.AAC.6
MNRLRGQLPNLTGYTTEGKGAESEECYEYNLALFFLFRHRHIGCNDIARGKCNVEFISRSCWQKAINDEDGSFIGVGEKVLKIDGETWLIQGEKEGGSKSGLSSKDKDGSKSGSGRSKKSAPPRERVDLRPSCERMCEIYEEICIGSANNHTTILMTARRKWAKKKEYANALHPMSITEPLLQMIAPLPDFEWVILRPFSISRTVGS